MTWSGNRQPAPARRSASRGLLLVVLAVVLVAAGAMVALAVLPGPGSGATSPPSGLAAAPGHSGSAAETPGAGSTSGPGSPGSSASTDGPAPGATADGGGSPPPGQAAGMPMVPVVKFWSTQTGVSLADLKQGLQSGSKGRWIVPTADAGAIGAALGITLAPAVQRGDAAAIRSAVKGGAFGILRASDVTPSVRALAIDGAALFGETRIRDAGQWPLTIPTPAGSRGWNQAATWTLLAGGDMFLDRGVYRMVVKQGLGTNYPFDGGTAIVTGHHCCGVYVTKYHVPDVQKTGNAGAVRALTQGADLAIANLETPIPDDWVYHAHGFVFNGDPGLLRTFTDAGLDWVTLANNHILDAGASGIADTRKNLAAAGLGYGGAGRNTAQAGQVSYLRAGPARVGIVACVAVGAFAGPNSAGGLPCQDQYVVPRIREARHNADVVIVFAHWGQDATVQQPRRTPLPSQRALATDWVAAGADLILGAHSHLAGGMDDIDGHVVLYSLGNFIFDQDWWTDTAESFLPEMTFAGNTLVQLTLHPFVLPDWAQPNLLDPATDDGAAILRDVKQASPTLGW